MSQAYMGQPPSAVYIAQPPPSGFPETGVNIQTAVPVTLGPKSVKIICRNCGNEIVTRVETKATTKTHLIALLLCVLGCWPCVCIPYCVDSCQNLEHFCPACGTYIGTYIQ